MNRLGDNIALTAGKYLEKVALINFGGSRFTYGEFNEGELKRLYGGV